MKIINKLIFGFVLLSALDIASPAHAYLDPGTGSMLLQMLLGGLAGVLVIGKLYWHRVMGFFGRGPAPSQGEDTAANIDDK